MPYFVYKVNRNGRRLLSEHLYLDDAKAKAERIRGAVVVDELGKVAQ